MAHQRQQSLFLRVCGTSEFSPEYVCVPEKQQRFLPGKQFPPTSNALSETSQSPLGSVRAEMEGPPVSSKKRFCTAGVATGVRMWESLSDSVRRSTDQFVANASDGMSRGGNGPEQPGTMQLSDPPPETRIHNMAPPTRKHIWEH